MIFGFSFPTHSAQPSRLSPTHSSRWLLVALMAFSLLFSPACSNKAAVAVAPTPPPPPSPTVAIAVKPDTAQPGSAVVITWTTENATSISIEPLGVVEANGSTSVTPTKSTTYRITAKGPGGVQEAAARVTVSETAKEVPTNDVTEAFTEEQSRRLDIFFDTDDFSIRTDQLATVKNDAAFLKEHPALRIVVEGHCDELGSTEYNLALGDRRAMEVKNALEKSGVDPRRLRAISYGKELPFCNEMGEQCFKLNRRVHLAVDFER
jgi:peptidoglycan-associated lipoprotein